MDYSTSIIHNLHIRFKGPKVWNSISENSKPLSISNFKESIKSDLVKDYYFLVFLLAVVLFPKLPVN